MKIFTGCCGFAERMQEYFKEFSTVEVQQTFYKIPQSKTLEKWRKLAPENFVFNVKCFQGVTHPPSSPTWKRFGKPPEESGLLKPCKFVFESWERTLKVANILKARIILIQLPKSFKECEESFENAESFFERIERKDFEIAIELRGWSEESVKKFCKKFQVIDCCDILHREPVYLGKQKTLYVRLHGKYENGRIIYSYSYSEEELKNIAQKVLKLKPRTAWIYFNNSDMLKNARKFTKLIGE